MRSPICTQLHDFAWDFSAIFKVSEIIFVITNLHLIALFLMRVFRNFRSFRDHSCDHQFAPDCTILREVLLDIFKVVDIIIDNPNLHQIARFCIISCRHFQTSRDHSCDHQFASDCTILHNILPQFSKFQRSFLITPICTRFARGLSDYTQNFC